ncbi:hypothetical protein L9F63_000477 [Diploptera punctata]|uniref:Androgen-dependent TFPI-regulating protein n=1 Tax=Diploptera punctata TaxID=6984 RepID=A0AAD8ALK7_DIPPU|nr:hypothetical protein L9F63_000477 [Diploptera punctata]
MTQIDYNKSDDHYVHNVMKKFKWRYFTGWNFTVQIIYFMTCVTEDIMRLMKHTSVPNDWIRRVKDFIFTSLFFPGTLFVTLMFWIVYLIDRKLVCPVAVEVVVPSWINHSIHTVIIVVLVIEMRITRHRYSKRSLGLAALAIYLTAYDILFFNAFITDGAWIYPLYQVLNWFYRMLLLVTSTTTIFGFYILGECLSDKLVGYQLQRINEKINSY